MSEHLTDDQWDEIGDLLDEVCTRAGLPVAASDALLDTLTAMLDEVES
jgi:hypothetical protein